MLCFTIREDNCDTHDGAEQLTVATTQMFCIAAHYLRSDCLDPQGMIVGYDCPETLPLSLRFKSSPPSHLYCRSSIKATLRQPRLALSGRNLTAGSWRL